MLLYRARRWLVQRPFIVKGRQRRYTDFVMLGGLLPEHSIVDVGSGPEGVSGTLGRFNDQNRIVALDLFARDSQTAPNVTFVLGDATSMPFADREFGRCLPNTISPVCSPGFAATEEKGQVAARPEYYGLLAARQLEVGRFVPVQISGEIASERSPAYATVHVGGTITLAIDNFATQGKTPLRLYVPGYGAAMGASSKAPALGAARPVTFGNASVEAAGRLRPIRKVGVAFRLELVPASAIVVTLSR